MKIKLKLFRAENQQYYNTNEIVIDLEEYLKGVVPSEIGNAPVEACAAQAISARNFAVSRVVSKGFLTDDSSKDQAFRASRLTGYPNAYQGVNKTKNMVLYYNNKIAQCYYSASNGGYTKSSKERWSRDLPYLIAQKDDFDDGQGNGHGVGLSQYGAKKRAEAGHTYQEILKFYFPNTYISLIEQEDSSMTKVEYLLKWMKDRIGYPYIYGATQQDCTVSYRKARIQQYPEYANNIKRNCPILSNIQPNCNGCKWYNNILKQPKQAYDCAQFIRQGAKAVGINNVVSGATSQWKSNIWMEKGDFKDIPDNKLCCVFRDKNGTKEHVGWYYNGIAYHAQGHDSGVVATNNKQYKSWTHYAIMKGLYNSSGDEIAMENAPKEDIIKMLYTAYVTASNGDSVNMRAAASKNAIILTKVPIGAMVDVITENDDWCQIIYNGNTGYMMTEFLSKNKTDNSTGDVYYVRLKCNSLELAQQLVQIFKEACLDD